MNTSQGAAVAMDRPPRSGSPQKQEITFADGTAIWLHALTDAERDCTFHRRLELDDGKACLLDLRNLVPSLGFQLPGANAREAASAIFHGMRQRFTSAALLRQEVVGGALQ